MTDAFDLTGKVCDRHPAPIPGIGAAVAAQFAQAGAAIVGAARREAEGQAVVEGITLPRRHGGSFIRTDVSSPGEVEELVRSAEERHGRVDTWVSNAGMLANGTAVRYLDRGSGIR